MYPPPTGFNEELQMAAPTYVNASPRWAERVAAYCGAKNHQGPFRRLSPARRLSPSHTATFRFAPWIGPFARLPHHRAPLTAYTENLRLGGRLPPPPSQSPAQPLGSWQFTFRKREQEPDPPSACVGRGRCFEVSPQQSLGRASSRRRRRHQAGPSPSARGSGARQRPWGRN